LEAREATRKGNFKAADIEYHAARRLAEDMRDNYRKKGDDGKVKRYDGFLDRLGEEIKKNTKKLEEKEGTAKTGRYVTVG